MANPVRANLTDAQRIALEKLFYELGYSQGYHRLWSKVRTMPKFKGVSRRMVYAWQQAQYSVQMSRHRKAVGKNSSIRVTAPSQMLSFDLGDLPTTENGFRYLFVATDNFSRKVWLIPIKDKKTHTITNSLRIVLKDVSPKIYRSDNASELLAAVKELKQGKQGKHVTNRPGNPWSNKAERVVGVAKQHIARIYRAGNHDWPSYVGKIADALNDTIVQNLKLTPNQIATGEHNEAVSAYMDTKAIRPNNARNQFKTGDVVRRIRIAAHIPKGTPVWTEQRYRVIAIRKSRKNTTATQYMLQDIVSGDKDPKPYFSSDLIPSTASENEPEKLRVDISKILRRKTTLGVEGYWVRVRNVRQPEWFSRDALVELGYGRKIERYEREHPLPRPVQNDLEELRAPPVPKRKPIVAPIVRRVTRAVAQERQKEEERNPHMTRARTRR